MNGDLASAEFKTKTRNSAKVRPLDRDIVWSGGRYAVVFSHLKGMDRGSLTTRLDWLVQNNPHLALDRLHQRGSRTYREQPPTLSASDLILSVHDPLPGRDLQSWATEFMWSAPEAILRIHLVGDDCYFLVSHLLGDFSGILPLCEFVLRGGDGNQLVNLRPTGTPPLVRAVAHKFRRQPSAVLRTGVEILSGPAGDARAPAAELGADSSTIETAPISVACWPKPYRDIVGDNHSDSGHARNSAPGTAKIISVALKAATDLGIANHPIVSVLVDCRHWLGPSKSPLVGNLASVIPIDTTMGTDEGNLGRQLKKHFRQSSPLIRLMMSDIYARFFSRLKRSGATRKASSPGRADPVKLIVTNLGEITMMRGLRQTFPEAMFSGMISPPLEGFSTLLIYRVLDNDAVGMLSNCHLGADDVNRWRNLIVERLFS
jgi:hypothetical protein